MGTFDVVAESLVSGVEQKAATASKRHRVRAHTDKLATLRRRHAPRAQT